MTPRSLGFRTDLFFVRFDGEVLDRGDYVVARSPLNPTHYWGNFLLFDHAPAPGELTRWRALFAEEIGVPPRIKHMLFALDLPEEAVGNLTPVLEPGFEPLRSLVLTSRHPCPAPAQGPGVEVRRLQTHAEWEGAWENQVACREPVHELEGYKLFKRRQMERYRRMTEAGLGAWFGAFVDGRLVGDLGIFAQGGLARFQAVGVHPEFRRRGLCRALLHHASHYGFEQLGAEELVIVADPDYHAAPLYRSAGFEPRENLVAITRWPRAEEGGEEAFGQDEQDGLDFGLDQN